MMTARWSEGGGPLLVAQSENVCSDQFQTAIELNHDNDNNEIQQEILFL